MFRLNGWTFEKGPLSELDRFVLVAAPHTSNWDFIYAIAAFDMMHIPVRFTIKKEWLTFPFKRLMLSLGAIPINREKGSEGKPLKGGSVKAMANLFRENNELVILVTPEGTRSPVKQWRTGFYYVAVEANVPIVLGYLDYEKKKAVIKKVLYPSGEFTKEMGEIMNFYSKVTPKFPEKSILDERYSLKMNDTL